MGLLPNLAEDLLPAAYAESPEQAIAQAGTLITAYAAGVVVGAPTIAAFSARFPRKRLLLVLVALFTVSTLASAMLPTFGLVFLARFVAALPHGAYFGVASLVAASLMGPGNRGKGVAFVLTGLTVANIVGVPAITWLGQHAGWRAAYIAVAAVFAITFVAIAFFVPPAPGDPTNTVRNELRAFTKPQVWFTLAIGAIGFGGMFAVYTYVAPIVTDVTGLPTYLVPLVLIAFGIGMTAGNVFGGWFADRGVKRALVVSFVVIIVSLVGLLLTAQTVVGLIVFVLLLGASSAAASPAVQLRLMDVAHDSQTIAAAVNHSALNIGNGLGAALGGVTIAAGLGYLSPIAVGIVLSVAGLMIAVVSFTVDRRSQKLAGGSPERQLISRS